MVDRDLRGRTLGDFVLVELIGEGGYGAVYRCLQPLLKRDAVVKVLHTKHQSNIALERFEQEAQLASLLDHPYAAHVYNFRAEPDGTRWIAMELVQGVTLSAWLREHGPMPLEQFVPFFECVAEVVQVAHERGIVHRDLKPSNVMVIERGGRLFPKLLDFGIAHVNYEIAFAEAPSETGARTEVVTASGSDTGQSTCSASSVAAYRLTRTGARFGSAPYMSPEQWYDAGVVGPASDIYALGVLAYETLAGNVPFSAKTTNEYFECHRDAEVPALGANGSPELDRIIRRALAKSPKQRHGDVLALAADFRAALRASDREQLRSAAQQWADRGRAPDLLWRGTLLAHLETMSSGAASTMSPLECSFVAASQRRGRRMAWLRHAALVLIAAAVVGVLQYRSSLRVSMAEQVARESEAEQGRQALLHDESADAVKHLEAAYQRGDRSPALTFMLARALQPRMAELARFTSSSGRTWSAAFAPDGKRVLTTDDKSARVWDARSSQLLFSMAHGDTVYRAAYSADGSRVFTASADGAVRAWSASTGELLHEMRWAGAPRPRYYALATSRDFVAAMDWRGTATHVWNSHTGAPIVELVNDGSEAASLEASPDGKWLAASGGDDVRVYNTTTWARVASMPGPRIRALVFAPDSSRLLVGTYDGAVSIRDMPSGAIVRQLREAGSPVDVVAFSRDGNLAAAGSRDGAVQVWNAASGAVSAQFKAHRGQVYALEFSAAGNRLLSASADGAIAVYDLESGSFASKLEGPATTVFAAHFDQTARRVVGASWDGTARIWNAASPYQQWATAAVGPECDTADRLDPDGRLIALSCPKHGTRVLDVSTGEMLAELPEVTSVSGDFYSALPAVTASGDRVAIARGRIVDIYALPSGQRIRSIEHRAEVNAVGFSPVGHDLVSGAVDGSVLFTQDIGSPQELIAASAGVDAVAFLPNGRIVVADASRRVRVIDRNLDMATLSLSAPSRMRLLLASSDGTRLIGVSTRGDQAAPALWDLQTGRLIAQLRGHSGRVFSARFVDGQRQILTAGRDGTARLWLSSTGAAVRTFQGDAHFLADAALSPDGSFVVAGGSDGLLRFWDTDSARLMWTLQAHKSYVVDVHFEGSDIVTRGFAGDVVRWRIPRASDIVDACHSARCAAAAPTVQ